MAWIMKNSAGTRIERRDEPYLDDELRSQLEKDVLPRYPTKRAATMPVLHAIQDRYNWLPFQAIEEAAAFLELSPAEVLDTASFYDQYFMQPKGKYTLWVCQSLSCELLGHTRLIDAVRDKLGIEPGQTTDDGRFTLKTAECLGSCGTAPCALVNLKLHEDLTPGSFVELLDTLD
jgi:NADH-quinone oxidoreductase subunit E